VIDSDIIISNITLTNNLTLNMLEAKVTILPKIIIQKKYESLASPQKQTAHSETAFLWQRNGLSLVEKRRFSHSVSL